MAGILLEKGYVKDTFADAIVAREKVFPTGLPTQVMQVAIPHTDVEHVNKACITVAKLAKPVKYREMANSSMEEKINAEMVFMMALNQKESQAVVLGQVIGIFAKPEVLQALKDANTKEEILAAILEGATK